MIDFSRISHRSFLGKILRLPLAVIPRKAVLRVLQGSLRGKKWIAGSGTHGYWLGSYELRKRRVFESIVNRGSVVFDIGAHVGFYTLLSSVLVGDKGQVFAFEPARQNLFYLKKHLHLNDVRNVTVVEAAVSDRCGEISFEQGEENTFTGRISTSGNARIKAVALDDLLRKGQILPPDYIKIDVEGAEMQVLSGAGKILEEGHPLLFLATHESDVHDECYNLLGALGYKLQPLDGESLNRSQELLAFWGNRSPGSFPSDRGL